MLTPTTREGLIVLNKKTTFLELHYSEECTAPSIAHLIPGSNQTLLSLAEGEQFSSIFEPDSLVFSQKI